MSHSNLRDGVVESAKRPDRILRGPTCRGANLVQGARIHSFRILKHHIVFGFSSYILASYELLDVLAKFGSRFMGEFRGAEENIVAQ
jgi:hypothetical protein